jgi:hypothetical protein
MAGKPNPDSASYQIRALPVGLQLSFPAERLRAIRTICSDIAFMYNCKYRVSRKSADRTVTVTRIN